MLVEILSINDTCHMIHMIHINVSNDTEIPIIYRVCLGPQGNRFLRPANLRTPMHQSLLGILDVGLGVEH